MGDRKQTDISEASNSTWYVLGMAFLMNFFIGAELATMPILFREISDNLNLDIVQLGTLWSVALIGRGILALPGGVVGDYLECRLVIFYGSLLMTLSYIGRGLTNNFEVLAAFMFLSALAAALVQPNLIKTISMWVAPSRLGMAIGISLTGFAAGSAGSSLTTGVLLSPLLGGWRNVMFFYAVIGISLSITWVLIVKGGEQNKKCNGSIATRTSIGENCFKIIQIRDVWLMIIAFSGISACIYGVLGYMPLYFENIGMKKIVAHALFSINFCAATIGNILVPALADRTGEKKVVYLLAVMSGIISVFAIPFTTGIPLWIAVVGFGITLAGAYSLSNTITVQIEGVGSTNAGTAIGMLHMFSYLFAFFFPIIGGVLAKVEPGRPFILWACLPIISVIAVAFTKIPRSGSCRLMRH
jgi:cyanate permease